jgi:hypothetical protein
MEDLAELIEVSKLVGVEATLERSRGCPLALVRD